MSDPTHTLANLPPHDGPTLAVLGHPIKHSLSPRMHHAALAEMAHTEPEFAAWRYLKIDVAPEDLAATLPRLHALGFRGINLTVPHKVLAVPHLAAIDPAAAVVGAVNTLIATPAGWVGHNTDGYGLLTALREDLGLDPAGRPILLLGAGGAARGAAVALLNAGCSTLWIANRTTANRGALIAQIQPRASQAGIPVHGFAPSALPADLPPGLIVINATSAGLKPEDPLPIPLAALPPPAGVYDMIYNPPETALLAAARALGLPAANGLGMLVHQGARALCLWTGRDVPVDPMRAALAAKS